MRAPAYVELYQFTFASGVDKDEDGNLVVAVVAQARSAVFGLPDVRLTFGWFDNDEEWRSEEETNRLLDRVQERLHAKFAEQATQWRQNTGDLVFLTQDDAVAFAEACELLLEDGPVAELFVRLVLDGTATAQAVGIARGIHPKKVA